MKRLLIGLIVAALGAVALHARQGTTILQPGDFTYLGYYNIIDNGTQTEFASGLAFRYVSGEPRIMFQEVTGELAEYSIAGVNFGDTLSVLRNDWQIQNVVTLSNFTGISYNAAQSKLWLTTGPDYTADVIPSSMWTIVLNEGNSIGAVHGPVALQGVNGKHLFGGCNPTPSDVQSTYSLPAFTCGWGGYTSLMAQGGGASLGSAIYFVPDIAGYANNTEIPSGTFKTAADHVSGVGTDDWYASGSPSSFDRGRILTNHINYFDGGQPNNPSTPPTGPPLPGAQWLSPAPDGFGRMTWGDSYWNTGNWISGQRGGLVMVASVCDGKCYYMTSTVNGDGHAYEIHVYDPATLANAVGGSVNVWNVQPATSKVVTLPGAGTDIGWQGDVPLKNVAGAAYDAATHRLYMLVPGGCRDNVGPHCNRLFVFDVNTGGAPPPPDTTPPVVNMTAPAAGTVSGIVTVSATATDASGISSVQFLIDGLTLGSPITSSPYNFTWDTGSATNGSHVLKATARDNAGNTATSTGTTVTVSNSTDSTPPTVAITAPSGTISGTVSVTATCTDNVACVGVQFTLDGINLGAEDTTAPYSVSWNTNGATNATHTLKAIGRDAAGNVTTSAGQVVTVNNPSPDTTPPTVTVTNTPGTYSGNLTLTATCSDNVACIGVQFLIDGGPVGLEDTTNPYSLVWDTTSVQNAVHTIGAIGRDAANNSASAATVSITVSNTPPPPPPPTDTTPPTVTWTTPLQGSQITTSSLVTLAANCSDDVGCTGVTFKADNVTVGSTITSPPYTVTWNIVSVSNGVHTLTATGTDAAGHSTVATITVTLAILPPPPPPDTTPPVVTWTTPTDGQTLTGSTASLTVTAADAGGIKFVQFYADGNALNQQILAPPYTTIWNMGSLAAGGHILGALASDMAGNQTAVNITVIIPTPPPPPTPDTTPPVVSFTSPANNSSFTVGQTVQMSASASDNVGVAVVQFYVDNNLLGSPLHAAPYAVSWNTTNQTAGAHLLKVTAADLAGNTASVTITVSLQTPTPPSNCTTSPLIAHVTQWPAGNAGSPANNLKFTTNFKTIGFIFNQNPRYAIFTDIRGCQATAR